MRRMLSKTCTIKTEVHKYYVVICDVPRASDLDRIHPLHLVIARLCLLRHSNISLYEAH